MSAGSNRPVDFGNARDEVPAVNPTSGTACDPTPLRRSSRVVAWVAILAVFVVLRVPFLSTPLERDEGAYAYVAQRALRGDVPYRDAFDHKPPGVFLIYATIFLIAGQSIESIHVGMYLWTLVGMAVLYRLVSRRFGECEGLTAALALAITTIDPSLLGQAANTEIFMIVPLTGALLCLLPAGSAPGRWRLVAAGALGAAGFWLKPVAATNIAFLAVWLVYLHLSETPRRPVSVLVGELGWLALGGALATAPVVIYFAVNGAWAPFFHCVFTFNSIYATHLAPPLRLVPRIFWTNVRPMILPLWPMVALSVAGFGVLMRRVRRDRVLFIGWLVFSFAGVCVGAYFREHYFIQALPALSALVGIGAAGLARRLARGRLSRFGGGVFVTISAAMVVVPIAANRAMLFAPDPETIAKLIYGSNPFDYSAAIASEVDRLTTPDDTVLIIGSEPQILFYADRKSASRYIYFSPLAAPPYEGLAQQLAATLREVEQSRPKVVIDASRIRTSLLAGPATDRAFFEKLYRILTEQGLKPVSFFMPVPTAANLGGRLFTLVDPHRVLEEEARLGARASGIMVLYRR